MAAKTLLEIWKKKEMKVLAAQKRRYPHFDPFINFSRNESSLTYFLSTPTKIQQHSFYPFIKASILTPRYKNTGKKNASGKWIRLLDVKDRPILFASHFDAYIYSWYSTLLTEKYERKIKSINWDIYDNVLAYIEKGKSNIEFADEAFKYIQDKGNCVALAYDVKGFFDRLDHAHLERMWRIVINKGSLPKDHLNVYKSLTEYAFVEMADLEKQFPLFFKHLEKNRKIKDKKKKHPTHRICTPEEFRKKVRANKLIRGNPFKNDNSISTRYGNKCGIPQGSPISACLSNIYMIEFDIALKKLATDIGGKYCRYCDDILFISDIKFEIQVNDTINKEIAKCHLEINTDKTEIILFKGDLEGRLGAFDKNDVPSYLQYLGFIFNGQNIYIRSSSVSKYHRRMTARIRENLKSAYGHNSIGEKVFKRKLLNRYSIKGERNFISYAKRAADLMQSPTIKKQYKNSINKVLRKFNKKKLIFETKRGINKIKR